MLIIHTSYSLYHEVLRGGGSLEAVEHSCKSYIEGLKPVLFRGIEKTMAFPVQFRKPRERLCKTCFCTKKVSHLHDRIGWVFYFWFKFSFTCGLWLLAKQKPKKVARKKSRRLDNIKKIIWTQPWWLGGPL